MPQELSQMKDLFESGLRDCVDKYLPPLCEDQPPIHEAIRYSLLGAGHRYRPITLLVAAQAFGINPLRAAPLACITEMIHTAAMILDDLPSFDDAQTRHGKPACHRQFGEYVAILASHQLLLVCLEIMADLAKEFGREALALIEKEYCALIAVMIKGEALDVASRDKKLAQGELIDMYQAKSASLFGFAAVAGALLANARAAEVEALREYGLHIGLAYQILDDISDLPGGGYQIDKDIDVDTRLGKISTFPKEFGLEKCRGFIEDYKHRASRAIDCLGERAEILRGLSELIAPRDKSRKEGRK